jgi:hypothetical protein
MSTTEPTRPDVLATPAAVGAINLPTEDLAAEKEHTSRLGSSRNSIQRKFARASGHFAIKPH